MQDETKLQIICFPKSQGHLLWNYQFLMKDVTIDLRPYNWKIHGQTKPKENHVLKLHNVVIITEIFTVTYWCTKHRNAFCLHQGSKVGARCAALTLRGTAPSTPIYCKMCMLFFKKRLIILRWSTKHANLGGRRCSTPLEHEIKWSILAYMYEHCTWINMLQAK